MLEHGTEWPCSQSNRPLRSFGIASGGSLMDRKCGHAEGLARFFPRGRLRGRFERKLNGSSEREGGLDQKGLGPVSKAPPIPPRYDHRSHAYPYPGHCGQASLRFAYPYPNPPIPLPLPNPILLNPNPNVTWSECPPVRVNVRTTPQAKLEGTGPTDSHKDATKRETHFISR